MENNVSIIPDKVKNENNSIISIISIGYKAGKLVDKMQDYEFLDTNLYAIDINRQFIDKLSLLHKILNKYLTCFIVELGDTIDENSIKVFFQHIAELEIKAKLLVVTLPHSSEGIEIRRKALRLLNTLEEFVNGISVVDYDCLPYDTLSRIYEEGGRRVLVLINTLVSSIVKLGILNFGFNDIATFLGDNSSSKHVDSISLYGDLLNFRQKYKDLNKLLPSKYNSVNDISNMILLVTYNSKTDENTVKIFLEEIVKGIMQGLNIETTVKWNIYNDSSMEEENFRLDMLYKLQ